MSVALTKHLAATSAEFILFWDNRLGRPPLAKCTALTSRVGDVWHSGPALGLAGLPRMLDYVEPIWLYNLDAPAAVEAASWRMSFRAALVRTASLRRIEPVDPGYETLSGASLDTGLRLLRAGAFMRQVVLDDSVLRAAVKDPAPTVRDERRFIRKNFGRRWLAWSSARQILTGRRRSEQPVRRSEFEPRLSPRDAAAGSVSVLTPTLDRYPYLRRELEQLRAQTVKPVQIIITDQTPAQRRDASFRADFPDLPIVYLPQEATGQSDAWNAAINASTGEHLLFLGDDADAIPPDFIERMLQSMHRTGADMVGANVIEAGGQPAADPAGSVRMADTFPIALVKRKIVEKCGLYDLAFNKGARADADMAVRWHLAGAILAFDPSIQIVHLKAPVGGLRAQKARIVTTFSSRNKVLHRDIPSVTEFYFVLKHYGSSRCRELAWQRSAATLIADGPLWRRIAKVFIGALLFPQTFRQMRQNRNAAAAMLADGA